MAAELDSPFLEETFLAKLERLRIVAKRVASSRGKGEHLSARRGSSLEFSDYRRYHRGDDLRYVDWNVYRRLERLLLKVFTGEEEMNIYLLLDTSGSMGEGAPPKIEYAKRVAAALGYIGLKNHDRVGVAAFAGGVDRHVPLARGRKQVLSLFQFLEGLPCGGETDLGRALKAFSLLYPARGLLVIVSDLWDPGGCTAALDELTGRRDQVLVIHLLDRSEIRFEPLGDVSLVDVESGRERRLVLDRSLVNRFEAEVRRYLDDTEAYCLNRRMDYLRAETATPFEDFVLRALRQGRTIR